MIVSSFCPACNRNWNFEQFCDEFQCDCGVWLLSVHECYYTDDGDGYCTDVLEIARNNNQNTEKE